MSDEVSDKEWIEQFDSEISKVTDLLEAGNSEAALNNLNELRHNGYDGYFLSIAYAETYIVLNKLSEAAIHIEKALSIKPEWHWAIVLKALLARINNSLDQEYKLMTSLTNKDGEGVIASLSVLSGIFENNQCRKQFEDSVYLLLKYFNIPSEDLGYYLLLGIRADQFQLSINLANRLMDEFPEKWTSYIGPAYLYAKMGDKEKGLKLLSKSEALPDFQSDDFIEQIRTLLK